jgi:hypothetical protein
MRKRLAQLVTHGGIALGFAAAAAFVAMMWPDIVSDHIALRTDVRTVAFTLTFASLIGIGVSLPFLRLADRIFVERDRKSERQG